MRCAQIRRFVVAASPSQLALATACVPPAVDVCLSSDGVPHIIHDLTVDRTTDGHGPGASARPLGPAFSLLTPPPATARRRQWVRPSPHVCPSPDTRPCPTVRGFSADGLKKLNAAAKFLCTSPGGAVCQSAQVPTLDELVDVRGSASEFV